MKSADLVGMNISKMRIRYAESFFIFINVACSPFCTSGNVDGNCRTHNTETLESLLSLKTKKIVFIFGISL